MLKLYFKFRHRQRSKSVINEEISLLPDKENKIYPIRRQSAINDIKAKVSKWTKVKAAFKWERANVTSLNECKSTDSGIGLTPLNTEVARFDFFFLAILFFKYYINIFILINIYIFLFFLKIFTCTFFTMYGKFG